MLTRLKVRGFKSLFDCELRFGPFTCIAGPNGVGKSNIFDAIRFLSLLAGSPLAEAAARVRDDAGRSNDARSLFYRSGSYQTDTITLEADFIVPPTGVDDLGQPARASTTFLSYSIELGLRPVAEWSGRHSLCVNSERLDHIKLGTVVSGRYLPFRHKTAWRDSVLAGRRTSPLISTHSGKVKLHQDTGKQGRPRLFPASTLPRTVLSTTSASEAPTALLARREMESWCMLQLEPSRLRTPDGFDSPSRLASDGSHLPACLHRIARTAEDSARVYAEVANRLSELLEDVRDVRIDHDPKREIDTLEVAGRDGTFHPARALSDGTLRFLALAVIERDPEATGVLCLEEPENGVHPERIDHVVRLLRDIAVDVTMPVDDENPLRQVIVNTHSPLVVRCSDECDVIFLMQSEVVCGDKRLPTTRAACLSGTWRSRLDPSAAMSTGTLLSYLEAPPPRPAYEDAERSDPGPRLVAEREDVRQLRLFDPPASPGR